MSEAPGSAAQPKPGASALFAKFLSENCTLIADPNSSSRVGLGRALAELGAKQTNVAYARTYEEAVQAIESRRPRMILCEFTLGPHSGLDLLVEQRRIRQESKDSIFALITANTSQSAVAAAAEEDVDTFVIKPYTLDTLKRTLIHAAVTKLHPSEYARAIEQGKAELFGGKLDEAILTFERAIKLATKPALACFYRGQAQELKTALDAAAGDFKQGLVHSKIHYKCLVGLYELMMKRKEYKEAYSVVKRVAQYFPANPKRLASVLRLAIMTESYEDVEAYYHIFTMVESRDDELVKYVCSALIVTARHYFMNRYNTRALELLEKAAVSCAGRSVFLRYIIELMAEFDRHEEAKTMLKRFPPQSQRGPDYLSMELLVGSRTLDHGKLLQKGRELIKQGIQTPAVYEVLIFASRGARQQESVEELLRVAMQKWPEQAARFNREPLPQS